MNNFVFNEHQPDNFVLNIAFFFSISFLDEKEKYDPSSFRDQIVAGLNDVDTDLEQV